MVLAPVLQRTGLIVLQRHIVSSRVRGWRRAGTIRPKTPGANAAHRRLAPVVNPGLWDGDDGEPTWEDAEWQ